MVKKAPKKSAGRAVRNNSNQTNLANYMNFANYMGFPNGNVQQLSQPNTIIDSNRTYFISINRTLLSYMYINYGLMQVLIDVPVDDAYRGGVEFTSQDLDDDDLALIYKYWQQNNILEEIKNLARWTRVFGGGGMIINTVGKPDQPLDIRRIKKDTPIEFYAADMWELSFQNANLWAEEKPYQELVDADAYDRPYFFYNVELHRSRVIKTKNKQAPSWLRMQLRGWGMSEMERAVRELNNKLKGENLSFELLDEGKVDVVKIEGFNESMLDNGRALEMAQRVQTAISIKNYQAALVLDKEDEFEQKQLNMSGVKEMMEEHRINIATAMRMPISKIFGIAPTGLNNDDENGLENYNSMIESEIRDHFNHVFVEIGKLTCQKLLGYVPEDFAVKYKPLRILKSTEEEEVKDKQFNRVMRAAEAGLLTPQQIEEQINLANLLPNKIKIDEGYLEEFKSAEDAGQDTQEQEA
jgi:phage-related protein (TIGR01555 family)